MLFRRFTILKCKYVNVKIQIIKDKRIFIHIALTIIKC